MTQQKFNQLDEGYAVRFDSTKNKRLADRAGSEAVIVVLDRQNGTAIIKFSDGARAFVTRDQLE